MVCYSAQFLIFFPWFAARTCTTDSGLSDNISGHTRISVSPHYDVIKFTPKTEEHEADVYLAIPDDALAKRNEIVPAQSPSGAIKWAEFADKLASMTGEEFRRQFNVSDVMVVISAAMP